MYSKLKSMSFKWPFSSNNQQLQHHEDKKYQHSNPMFDNSRSRAPSNGLNGDTIPIATVSGDGCIATNHNLMLSPSNRPLDKHSIPQNIPHASLISLADPCSSSLPPIRKVISQKSMAHNRKMAQRLSSRHKTRELQLKLRKEKLRKEKEKLRKKAKKKNVRREKTAMVVNKKKNNNKGRNKLQIREVVDNPLMVEGSDQQASPKSTLPLIQMQHHQQQQQKLHQQNRRESTHMLTALMVSGSSTLPSESKKKSMFGFNSKSSIFSRQNGTSTGKKLFTKSGNKKPKIKPIFSLQEHSLSPHLKQQTPRSALPIEQMNAHKHVMSSSSSDESVSDDETGYAYNPMDKNKKFNKFVVKEW